MGPVLVWSPRGLFGHGWTAYESPGHLRAGWYHDGSLRGGCPLGSPSVPFVHDSVMCRHRAVGPDG